MSSSALTIETNGIAQEGFPDYELSTDETGAGFYVFVLVYSILAFLLIAPLTIWGRHYEKERQKALLAAGIYNHQNEFADSPSQNPPTQQQYHHHHQQQQQLQQQQFPPNIYLNDFPRADPVEQQTEGSRKPIPPSLQPKKQNSLNRIFREIDRLATTTYPDNDPDMMSRVSRNESASLAPSQQPSRQPSQLAASQASQASRTHSQTSRAMSRAASRAPSRAPTGISGSSGYFSATSNPKVQVWDVGGRKWRQRRPIGRIDVMQKNLESETHSMGGSSVSERKALTRRGTATSRSLAGSRGESMRASRTSRPAGSRGGSSRQLTTKGMSDVASSILTDDLEEAQQRRIMMIARRRRGLQEQSFSSASELPEVNIDDISPNDAADALDPGRINSFEQAEEVEITVCCGPAALWKPQTCVIINDSMVELAEPDQEMRRIVQLGIPLTFGAMSASLFHALTVAFISHYLGTDSMVAYILVHLMLTFTDEFVGAISDAESTLCSHSLSIGNWVMAGKYAQIALFLHLLLHLPLLIMWVFIMDDLVLWLVHSERTATLAVEFTQVAVFYHLLQSVSRILAVLLQLTGHEQFETRFALVEGIVTVVATCCTVAFVPDMTLQQVAWIKLLVTFGAFAARMTYATIKGWLKVFRRGLLSFALSETTAVFTLAATSVPLFFGAFLEYGEWEILVFFVAYLGPAEVATWGLLGIIWKLLESSTEGIGEAASIRVAYHLGSGNSKMAQHASNKALFVSSIQALFVTSLIFMLGKNISSLLTADPTLQHMLNHTMTELGLGNLVMSFALNVWALVGAQGRYRLATLVILLSRWVITIPIALVCIYGFNLDLNSVMGAVIVGFATAVLGLGYVFFRSDWDRLSRILQELQSMMEPDSFYDDDSSDSDEESEDIEESMDEVSDDLEVMPVSANFRNRELI